MAAFDCVPPGDILGHAWDEVASDWTPAFGGVPLTIRCTRCGKERRDTLGENTGNLNGRRYVQAAGWVKTERLSMSDARLAWIEQHITDARKARRGKLKAVNT